MVLDTNVPEVRLASSRRYYGEEGRRQFARIQRNVSPWCMDTDGFCIDACENAVVDRELRRTEALADDPR